MEIKNNTKKNKKQIEEEFKEIKNLLSKPTNGYNIPYIRRMLHEKYNLRKVLLAVIKNNPSRISEVSEEALLTRPTCYSQLHKLLDLKMVNRVFVIDVVKGEVKNPPVKKKFEEWAKHMPEQLKRYYLAKTSFWEVSDFGKQFCKEAYAFDQEFREKTSKTITPLK